MTKYRVFKIIVSFIIVQVLLFSQTGCKDSPVPENPEPTAPPPAAAPAPAEEEIVIEEAVIEEEVIETVPLTYDELYDSIVKFLRDSCLKPDQDFLFLKGCVIEELIYISYAEVDTGYSQNLIQEQMEKKELVLRTNGLDEEGFTLFLIESEGIVSPPDLTHAEKVALNKELEEKYILPVWRMITENNNDIELNKNLLTGEKNKFFYVWEMMLADPALESSFEDGRSFTGEMVSGCLNIKLDVLKDYYKKVLGTNLDEAFLSNMYSDNQYCGIKDGVFYGSKVTGWGPYMFLLKANSLMFDEKTGKYVLTADFLFLPGDGSNDGTDDYDCEALFDFQDAGVLTWDPSLNYAKLVIEYTKDADENCKPISLEIKKE